MVEENVGPSIGPTEKLEDESAPEDETAPTPEDQAAPNPEDQAAPTAADDAAPVEGDAADAAEDVAEDADDAAPAEVGGVAPVEADEADPEGEEDDDDELLVTPGMNWFVLRVASNKEDSVRATLLRKIKIEGFNHLVNRILVPTEKVKQIKQGRQKIIEKKLYPGYVFVEMQLEEDGRIPQDVFFLIKETTGVGDFIGTAGRPSPMKMYEVEKMIQASKPAEEAPQVKMEFQPGDHIRINEGPFENTEGTVDELLPDQGKVRVIVQVFGRATPIELEYWQIERFEE